MKKNKWIKRIGLVVGAGIVVLAAYAMWQIQKGAALPDYIASGNGRIEAEEVHIAAKTGGRVSEIFFDEGQQVSKGDVIARMDKQELMAKMDGAKSVLASAENSVAGGHAEIAQRTAEYNLAQKQLERIEGLVAKKAISQEVFDQRKAAAEMAKAVMDASLTRLSAAENQMKSAQAQIEQLQVQIDDCELRAPIDGRVQYRLSEPGEILGAGAKLVTLLDLENVYMTIFLPTDEVGRVAIGSEARIILDAAADYVIPATVSFVSPEAQFTPRAVETHEEREKLMFRVKLKIPKELLREHSRQIKTGLPGVGYVLMGGGDKVAVWPQNLAIRLPDPLHQGTQ